MQHIVSCCPTCEGPSLLNASVKCGQSLVRMVWCQADSLTSSYHGDRKARERVQPAAIRALRAQRAAVCEAKVDGWLERNTLSAPLLTGSCLNTRWRLISSIWKGWPRIPSIAIRLRLNAMIWTTLTCWATFFCSAINSGEEGLVLRLIGRTAACFFSSFFFLVETLRASPVPERIFVACCLCLSWFVKARFGPGHHVRQCWPVLALTAQSNRCLLGSPASSHSISSWMFAPSPVSVAAALTGRADVCTEHQNISTHQIRNTTVCVSH